MNRIKRAVLWAVLAAVILLAVLSVYGAFIGAERAQTFFTSVPLAVYWFAAIALLGLGIVLFRRLLRVPSLLAMHLGCILVLLGAMWGSKAGHDLQSRLLGIEKIPYGQMGMYEQMQENLVQLADANETRELPFFVRLKEFRLEYYEPGTLLIQTRDGQSRRLPARTGQRVSLGEELGTVTVNRVFRNFKMDIEDGKRVTYDAPGGSNPALEVTIERPGAAPGTRYVFERRFAHMNANDPLVMSYLRSVKDYVSELEIIQDGQVVAAKDIEVNHPLYYGGYHFYQHQWGEDRVGQYSVLQVVSSSGLNAVYGGYLLLTGGIFWQFWGRRLLRGFRARYVPVANVPGEAK